MINTITVNIKLSKYIMARLLLKLKDYYDNHIHHLFLAFGNHEKLLYTHHLHFFLTCLTTLLKM